MSGYSRLTSAGPRPGWRVFRTTRRNRRAGVAGLAAAAACTTIGAIAIWSPGMVAHAAPTPGITQYGRATMNSLGTSGLGNCAFPPEMIANQMYTAAPVGDYDSAGGCGSYLDVTGSTGKTVRVLLADKCPECEPGHLDMSPESFRKIAPRAGGVQQISYTAVRDPVLPAPISVRLQSGSTAYWIGFLVMNHGNPLTSVEYLGADDAWHALKRSMDNYWQSQTGAGAGPFTLRLTDAYGRQVVVDKITLTTDAAQDTGVWMYEGGTPEPTATATPVSPSATATTSAAPAPCSAEVRMDGSWPDGYQALLTVRNNGTTKLHPWQVSWTVPAGVTITGWNGTFTQEGTKVTVVAPEWSDGLAPGASVEIGHKAVGVPQPAPTTIQLNGETCSAGLD